LITCVYLLYVYSFLEVKITNGIYPFILALTLQVSCSLANSQRKPCHILLRLSFRLDFNLVDVFYAHGFIELHAVDYAFLAILL